MKKVLYACIAAVMLFAGCGQPAASPKPSVTAAAPAQTPSAQTPGPVETPAETASPKPTETGTPEGVNLVENGDFAAGADKWQTFLTSGGAADFKAENGEAAVDIKACGGNDYSVQLYYDGFKLETGGKYMLAFEARSSIARTIGARIQLNGGAYTGYADKVVELTTDTQTAGRLPLSLRSRHTGHSRPRHASLPKRPSFYSYRI